MARLLNERRKGPILNNLAYDVYDIQTNATRKSFFNISSFSCSD